MWLKEILKPIYYFLMNCLTFLTTLFIRRDKSVVLMGSWYGYRFGGNTRFLFQYLSENKNKYNLKKVVWVTRSYEIYNELLSMGYDVYMMKSLKGIYYHFKAGVHAVSVNTAASMATSKSVKGDIMGELSLGAVKLYVSHAIVSVKGNRLLEYDHLNWWNRFTVSIYSLLHRSYFFRHLMLYPGGWDENIFLSSSKENTKRDEERKLETQKALYIETGVPELCECLQYTKRENEVINFLSKKKKVILYAPTYRTSPKTGYVHPLNNPSVCDYLRNHEYLWIDKLHPGAKDTMNAEKYDEEYTLKLETEFDLNIIMRFVDVFITDFSSVFYKAIYFDKPIIYYLQDYDGYVQYDKSLVKNYRQELVGVQADSPQQLICAIEECLSENYFVGRREMYEEKKKIHFDGRKSEYEEICNSLFGINGVVRQKIHYRKRKKLQ